MTHAWPTWLDVQTCRPLAATTHTRPLPYQLSNPPLMPPLQALTPVVEGIIGKDMLRFKTVAQEEVAKAKA